MAFGPEVWTGCWTRGEVWLSDLCSVVAVRTEVGGGGRNLGPGWRSGPRSGVANGKKIRSGEREKGPGSRLGWDVVVHAVCGGRRNRGPGVDRIRVRLAVGPEFRCASQTRGWGWRSEPMSAGAVRPNVQCGRRSRGSAWRSAPRSGVAVRPEIRGGGQDPG